MKRLLAIFVLTRAEQRLVIFVVVLLVAVAWFKQHRDSKLSVASPPAETGFITVLPSPTRP